MWEGDGPTPPFPLRSGLLGEGQPSADATDAFMGEPHPNPARGLRCSMFRKGGLKLDSTSV